MEKPVVAVCVRDEGVKNALARQELELIAFQTPQRLLTSEFPRSPRLFLIQAVSGQVNDLVAIIGSLRRNWPLTDVLLWIPGANGAVVRTCFQAGAKDVVVDEAIAVLLASIAETMQQQRILPKLNDLNRLQNRGSRFESMWSRSAAMWDLFALCTHVAPSDATVLIVGETGTGKELFARAVHRRSGRQGRFVAANCASIPPELINSELFGYEKGAFTGADRAKKGLVRHAHEGTLFLDEIGDMTPEAQQSLLRVLQEKRIRPVGSRVEQKVDVRIVAATNVILDQAVREGRFREDLFYRLDVIRINVPPLRQRPEDILFLFGHFSKRLAKHYGLEPPILADSFLDALVAYPWPGNVRQLENFTERLVLARPQRALTARDFTKLRSSNRAEAAAASPRPPAERSRFTVDTSKPLQENIGSVVEQLEREYLEEVLRQHAGRVAEAARHADISRRTLLRKMNRYGIDKQQFKS